GLSGSIVGVGSCSGIGTATTAAGGTTAGTHEGSVRAGTTGGAAMIARLSTRAGAGGAYLSATAGGGGAAADVVAVLSEDVVLESRERVRASGGGRGTGFPSFEYRVDATDLPKPGIATSVSNGASLNCWTDRRPASQAMATFDGPSSGAARSPSSSWPRLRTASPWATTASSA